MSFLFGGAPKVKRDPIKEYQQDLRKSVRSMDREDIKAAAQEKVLITGMQKLANEQRLDLCKLKAKELIRLRAHRSRLMTMKGHLSTLQQQLATVGSAKIMQETVAKTTHLLRGLNQRLDARSIHKMLLEFERNSTAFQDGQEILEETLDDIFETDNEQAVTDQAVSGIFQELGFDMLELMGKPEPQPGQETSQESLENRLERLKM